MLISLEQMKLMLTYLEIDADIFRIIEIDTDKFRTIEIYADLFRN